MTVWKIDMADESMILEASEGNLKSTGTAEAVVVDMDDKSITVYDGFCSEVVVHRDAAGLCGAKVGDIVWVALDVVEDGFGQSKVAKRAALLGSLREGMSVKGVVKNLTDYGAFVDLGGVDGLLHNTDMAWKRIKHPSEIVEVGQEIDVKILKFDRERNRVSLGLKQLGVDPWVGITGRYPEGSRVKARITNLTDYCCFAELEEGVEGLVHASDMDWTNKNVHPFKIVKWDDEVEVMVLDIDEERRRISLGIKQCQQNPWDAFAFQYAKGDKISGNIKSITDFGIFIGLEGNIDGLVHVSDISWNETGEEAVHNYKKGDEIESVILSIDPERERILLGVKQLETDPFSN
jgi:small subunit ribosomal protein S1